MHTPRILAALAAAIVSLPASAMLTGEELYQMLKSGNPATKQAAMAYVQGFTDATYSHWDFVKDQPGLDVKHSASFFCLPRSMQTKRVAEIVVKHLEDTPADRKTSSDLAIMSALGTRWPCLPPSVK